MYVYMCGCKHDPHEKVRGQPGVVSFHCSRDRTQVGMSGSKHHPFTPHAVSLLAMLLNPPEC